MTKNVILINPPAPKEFGNLTRDGRCQSEESTWSVTFPASTLASIAGHIRQAGFKIKFVDCIGENISIHQLLLIVKKFKPDYAVINTATPSIESDLKVVRLIKDINSSTIIGVYGTMPSDLPNEIKKMEPLVDYCLRGDPETPALLMVQGKRPPLEVWVEKNLDNLATPAYDLMSAYFFPLTGERWVFLMDGKGCPYRCVYCVEPKISGRHARYKSAERIVEDIDFIVNKLNIHLFMFWDELFTLNKKRCLDICRLMIEKGLNKKCRWMATTRVDRVDEELLVLMKQAGCWMLAFGLESGDQNVLDIVKKDITLAQSRKTVKMAKRIGFKTLGHFIVGLPGSSPRSEAKSISFAKELDLDFVQFYTCTAFPGSELYEIAQKNKWLVVKDWGDIEQGNVNLTYPSFSAAEIHKWRRKAYTSFYFRPRFFYNFFRCLSLRALINIIPRGIKFTSWIIK